MAKGDKNRAETGLGSLDTTLTNTNNQFQTNYNNAYSRSLKDYDSIMGDYRNFLGRDSAAKSTFSDLAGGGGVDANAMRSRATDQVRSVYANAKRNLDRNKSIQGGYNPGYSTMLGRFAREQSQGAADASTNVEASIQDLISRNRLAGAEGLAGLESQNLGAINAMGNLYGTSPGLATSAGNQLLASQGDLIDAQRLRQSITNVPSNFETGMSRATSAIGMGSKIAGALGSLGGPTAAGSAGALGAAGMVGGALPFASSIPIAAAPGALALGGGTAAGIGAGTSGAASTAGGIGAGAGIGIAGAATLGIGAAVAAAALAWQKNRNSTKNAREDFSKKMGFKNTEQLYNILGSLGPEGEQLRQQGLNVIGKKDTAANKQWMEAAAKLIAAKYSKPQSSITGGFNFGQPRVA